MDDNKTTFMDESIIEMITDKENELEQEERLTRIKKEISRGFVTFKGECMEFVEKSLFEDRIKIFLPKDFELMDRETASIKYPYEARPNPIFTDNTTTKNVTFNYTQSDVDEDGIGEFKDSMRIVLERMQPSANWLEDAIEQINGRNVGFFEIVIPALDANVYNLMFFTELSGMALIGCINCLEEDMEDWIPVAKGIMSSLKILDKDE